MKQEIKKAIQEYQCTGCIHGHDTSCFKANPNGGEGCGKQVAGTLMFGVGSIFLGLPKGFNRIGKDETLTPNIYESFADSDWTYDKFNVPVWKHMQDGHTFVRGMMPRINRSFLHIFLEDCREKIDCLELSEQDINDMD